MNKTKLLDNLWIGTHYYRAPSPPPTEWQEDMENCRKLGFDFLQVRVFWRWHERKEGQYYWTDLDEFMAKARATGNKVVFQINLENAPEYVFQKYDGYRVDIKGTRIWPTCNAAFYVGGWIPCFDNPDVMHCALRFVEELVKRYKDDSTLAFYHAWNEPRSRPMGECACSHSIESYRQWLAERFGTIDKLNEFTGKCWGDFDQIDAARDTSDFTDMYLWRQWGASRITWRVSKVTELLKQLDPDRAVISHVGMASVIQDPLTDISDDIAMNDVTDLYGTSFPVRIMQEYSTFMLIDWLRYVGRGKFSNYELYPSMGQYFPELPGGLVEQWMWASVCAGAQGLCFWQYKKERLGVEINDAGLVETDGSFNETTEIVAKSMNAIRLIEPLLKNARVPRAKIALCYDLQSDLLDRLKFTIAREGDYSISGKLRCDVPGGYPYNGDLQGLYHLIMLSGYACDFVTPRRWKDELRDYPVVILPCFQIMDQERADVLVDYVKNGGTLIVDAAFGRRCPNTNLSGKRPGAGLTDIFGFQEINCTELNKSFWQMRFDNGLVAQGQFSRTEYNVFEGTEIIARWCDNDAPAAVRRVLGKGQIIAIGAYLGLQSWGDWDSVYDSIWKSLGIDVTPGNFTPWQHLLLDQFKQSHAQPDFQIQKGIVERCIMTADNKEMHFVFRRFGGQVRLSDEDWKAVSRPGKLILELDNVKAFLK